MSRTPQQRQGDWAEQRALRLLRQQGWWILERQWRCRWGELDLLLHKPGRLLLVEHLQSAIRSDHDRLLGVAGHGIPNPSTRHKCLGSARRETGGCLLFEGLHR
jgi:hypothetical protein